jgi:acyl-CoA synthetase (AMP-forming)/AMP-acid ligase II
MMPLFHIGGIVRNVCSPILAGGCVIACQGFDPILFWDILYSRSFTWYYAAPTMHHAILMEADRRPKPLPVDSVRFIANAAGGLLPVLAEGLKVTFGAVILTSYGMTECMPISSPTQSYMMDPVGTSGQQVGPDIIITDEDHSKILQPGEVCCLL